MNVNLLHNKFLDHHAMETGKQQADGLKNQDDTQEEDKKLFYDRCTQSSLGNEFNELAFNKANSQSLESHNSSVKSSSVRHRSCSRSNR